jgi:hypothetical protein
MRLGKLYLEHGIKCDYATRREFHRAFWDAVRAQLRRCTSSSLPTHKPHAASR